MSLLSRNKSRAWRKSGQVASEYLVVAVGVLIAVFAVSAGAEYHCIKNGTGNLETCKSLTHSVGSAFKNSVEDITFLINLPF